MIITKDVLLGQIKITGLPEGLCLTTFSDLIKALPGFLSVEVPDSISNVTVSQSQPNDDQRDNLWIRVGASHGFIGMYVYSAGDWQNIYPGNAGIYWFDDERIVRPGWEYILDGNPNFTTSEIAQYKQRYIKSDDQSHYVLFAAQFVGF